MSDNDPVTIASCREIHSQTKAQFDVIQSTLDAINDRLYHDNGSVSIQTRLDRHERVFCILTWILSIVGTALLIQLVTFTIAATRYLVGHLP